MAERKTKTHADAIQGLSAVEQNMVSCKRRRSSDSFQLRSESRATTRTVRAAEEAKSSASSGFPTATAHVLSSALSRYVALLRDVVLDLGR